MHCICHYDVKKIYFEARVRMLWYHTGAQPKKVIGHEAMNRSLQDGAQRRRLSCAPTAAKKLTQINTQASLV